MRSSSWFDEVDFLHLFITFFASSKSISAIGVGGRRGLRKFRPKFGRRDPVVEPLRG